MAMKHFLDRQLALIQMLRWGQVFETIDKEIKKGNSPRIDDVIEKLQNEWKTTFEKGILDMKRRPKFKPIREL